jgi:hypothetical protein
MQQLKITEDQIKIFEQMTEEYNKIALDTKRFTVEEAKEAMRKVYEVAELEFPEENFYVVDSINALFQKYKEITGLSNLSGSDLNLGSLDAHWLKYHVFYRDILKHEGLEKLKHLEPMLKLGWFLMCDDLCIVSQKPVYIGLLGTRLHAENRKALEFSDGTGIYAWKGVLLKEKTHGWIISNPEKITVHHIMKEKNAEIRRVMLERFGFDRFFEESDSKLLDDDPKHGKLYQIDLPDDEPIKLLKVVNSTPEPDGTFKEYIIPVPENMETSLEARAWTFDCPPEEFEFEIET